MEQIDLMLPQILRRYARAAQRAKAGVNPVDGPGLSREGFHQLPAPPDERARLLSQFARRLKRGDSPDVLDGEVMPVERDICRRSQDLAHTEYSRDWQARSAGFQPVSNLLWVDPSDGKTG